MHLSMKKHSSLVFVFYFRFFYSSREALSLYDLSVRLSSSLSRYASHVRQIICGHFNDSNGQQILNFRLFFFV